MKKKKEMITIPIYYTYDPEGNIFIDIDSIEDEFELELGKVVENPKKFVYLSKVSKKKKLKGGKKK